MAGLETSEEDRHFYPGTIIASFIRWTLGITISIEVNHHTTSILSYDITWRESAWSTHTYLKRLRSACSQYKHNLTCTRFNNLLRSLAAGRNLLIKLFPSFGWQWNNWEGSLLPVTGFAGPPYGLVHSWLSSLGGTFSITASLTDRLAIQSITHHIE